MHKHLLRCTHIAATAAGPFLHFLSHRNTLSHMHKHLLRCTHIAATVAGPFLHFLSHRNISHIPISCLKYCLWCHFIISLNYSLYASTVVSDAFPEKVFAALGLICRVWSKEALRRHVKLPWKRKAMQFGRNVPAIQRSLFTSSSG